MLGAFPTLFDEARIGLSETHKATWLPYGLLRRLFFRVKQDSAGEWVCRRGLPGWIMFGALGGCAAVVKDSNGDPLAVWLAMMTWLLVLAGLKAIEYGATIRTWRSPYRDAALPAGALKGVLFASLCLVASGALLLFFFFQTHFAAVMGALVFIMLVNLAERTFDVFGSTGRRFMTVYAAEFASGLLEDGVPGAAVVVSLAPLLVAAYSREMDCVMPLEFDSKLVDEYGVNRGSRLLSMVNYRADTEVAADLLPGPDATGRVKNFHPAIADFITDDVDGVARLKQDVEEEDWKKAAAYGDRLLRRPGLRPRDGRPLESMEPAEA